MNILVTGHNGYIGSIMSSFFLVNGHRVGGIDTNYFPSNPLGYNETIVKSLNKDIRDVSISDLKGFDAVVHLAALSNDPMAELDVDLTYDINLFATLRLAQVAKMAGVKRFLFSSSCSVYGAGSMSEDGTLYPISAYAISKAKAEEGLSKLADKDFSPVFLRNGTAYGASPRHRTDLVVNSMVLSAHKHGVVNVIGDGGLWRPVVHIGDMSKAFLLALEAPKEVVHNQIFNVGSNKDNYRIREIAECVKEIIPDCEIKYAKTEDSRSYQVEFSKIENVLGFKTSWNILDGIENLLMHYESCFIDFPCVRLHDLKHLMDSGKLDKQLRWRNNEN